MGILRGYVWGLIIKSRDLQVEMAASQVSQVATATAESAWTCQTNMILAPTMCGIPFVNPCVIYILVGGLEHVSFFHILGIS